MFVSDGSSKNFRSKRAKFLSTYVPNQPWSLPDSVIYYITKNPSTSKCYQKMVQSCKHFFIKNPILVVHQLFPHYYFKNEWIVSYNYKSIYLKNVSIQIWIINEFKSYLASEPISSIIPKIYQCDIQEINLWNKTISLNNLKFLASKSVNVILYNLSVINEDGSDIALETIIEALPKAKNFEYSLNNRPSNVITFKTVSKLLKIPHFSKFNRFRLTHIPEIFDIELFYDYIKKNENTIIEFYFSDEISEVYQKRLQNIIDEIIATENRDYKLPYITFAHINEVSFLKLRALFFKRCTQNNC